MKKILILWLFFLGYMGGGRVATAFEGIGSLRIGQVISGEVLEMASKEINTNPNLVGVSVYTFKSFDNAHPHIIHVKDGKLIFLQETVSVGERMNYQELIDEYGEPELRLEKTRAETLLSYPSIGLAFVINEYSGLVERAMSVDDTYADVYGFILGKNFAPIENFEERVVVEPRVTETAEVVHETEVVETPRNPLKIPVVLGLVALVGIVGMGAWQVKKRWG